jgi:N-acetylglutamate synthase-like GNAT family acetyltransferase
VGEGGQPDVGLVLVRRNIRHLGDGVCDPRHLGEQSVRQDSKNILRAMDSMSQDVSAGAVAVRAATEADAAWVEQVLTSSWGTTEVARRRQLVDLRPLPKLVAEYGAEPVGLLTYLVGDDSWEVVPIDATTPGVGAGTALLRAVAALAREAGARRVWLITTNDNTRALHFYQRNGFDLVAVHRDAVAEARRLKPSIPLASNDGIPIRHEIELELRIS